LSVDLFFGFKNNDEFFFENKNSAAPVMKNIPVRKEI